jgi:hypothetical protein
LNGSLVAEFVPATGSAAQPRRVSFQLGTGDQRELGALIPSGGLRFEVEPSASVLIDTHSFGIVTKGSLSNIAIGHYTMRLARDGYPDFDTDVSISAGQELQVRFVYNFVTRAWVRR